MQNVNIRTAQNVGIEYELAGLGARMGAFAIDVAIMIAYYIALSIILSRIGLDSLWMGMLFLLPAMLYHLLCEIFLNGQSIGKKQMNIRVVRLDGSSPTIGGYLLRWLLRPIDISLFSGGVAVLAIALSKKGQRLGDMAANTTVIKVAREVKVSSHELIKNLQEEHKVTFPEARQLSDVEINVIKEALLVNKQHANNKPVFAVADKIKKHLNISSDMPPVKFLYTIVKDYKYITSQQ
ncbi:MAG: RDD family protein [Fulvivirga sp.]